MSFFIQGASPRATFISSRRPTSRKPPTIQNAYASVIPQFVTTNTLALRRVSRTIEFWARVLSIWSTYKAVQVFVGVQRPFRDDVWQARVWDAQHRRAAEMMYDFCVQMKGFFVKAGQLISLQAFVPKVIREKLSLLHDDMPPMPREQARSTIVAELTKLGHTLDDFESMDLDSVLGSASIAQVHRGTLRDGRDVAIKVQIPDNEPRMIADLENTRVLAEILQRTELRFDLVSPVVELKKQIALEFDFEHEAKCMHQLGWALRDVRGVSVPTAIPGFVSRRLLVMTYLDGVPLTKLERIFHGGNKRRIRIVGRKVLKKLATSYAKMILQDGYFHADCHPGNILVMNRKMDIALLDFGQTKRLGEHYRRGFVRLVDAMARKDTAGIGRHLYGMGIGVEYVGGEKGKKEVQGGNGRGKGLTVEEKMSYTMFDTAVVEGVSDNPFSPDSVLRDAEVRKLPEDLMLLLRTTTIMRGISRATNNGDFSMVSEWGRTARREVRKMGRHGAQPSHRAM